MGKARRCASNRTANTICGNGADDEDPGSDFEGDGGQAEVVGSGRDHRDNRPDDAALAGALPGARIQRAVGPPQTESEPEACGRGGTGAGLAVVSGEIFRLQRAALSRETGRRAGNGAALYLD